MYPTIVMMSRSISFVEGLPMSAIARIGLTTLAARVPLIQDGHHHAMHHRRVRSVEDRPLLPLTGMWSLRGHLGISLIPKTYPLGPSTIRPQFITEYGEVIIPNKKRQKRKRRQCGKRNQAFIAIAVMTSNGSRLPWIWSDSTRISLRIFRYPQILSVASYTEVMQRFRCMQHLFCRRP